MYLFFLIKKHEFLKRQLSTSEPCCHRRPWDLLLQRTGPRGRGHTTGLGSSASPAESEAAGNGRPLGVGTAKFTLRKQKQEGSKGIETRGQHRLQGRRPVSRFWAEPRPLRPTPRLAFLAGPESKYSQDACHAVFTSGSEKKTRHPHGSLCSSVTSTMRPKCAARTQLGRLQREKKRSRDEQHSMDHDESRRPAGHFFLTFSR